MKASAAGMAFLFASVIAAVGCGFLFDGLGPATSLLAMGVGLGAAVCAARTVSGERPARPDCWGWAVLGVFALASLRAFLWVLYASGDQLFVLSPNNLGDMSLHLNFIRYLAGGVPFWPASPILSEVPLTYPLGSDLFNALLEMLGVPTILGLVWVGLAGAALTAVALWRWGGAFAIAAFLFNGGLAGFALLSTGELRDFQSDFLWKNLFLAMFVTQRGLLFALPAGLLLLTAWRAEIFRGEKNPMPLGLQVLLYAGMPLFSVHTFLFLSVVLAVLFLRGREHRRRLARLAVLSVLPATGAVVLVTGMFSASGGIHFAWGWMLDGKGWGFFVRDFGLVVVFGLVTGILAWRKKNAEARCFVGVAIGVFAVSSVLAFSSWPWDNMKLLLWCWLVLAPSLWSEVLRPLPVPARAALCGVLFFSGAVSLVGGLDGRHGYLLARRSELDAWQRVVRDLPMTDRFACEPDYNHPLILLGRKVVCGYEGHLASHGLDYRVRLSALRDALDGRKSWPEAAPFLQADWAAIRQTDNPGQVREGEGVLLDLRPWLRPSPSSPAPPQPRQQAVGLPW